MAAEVYIERKPGVQELLHRAVQSTALQQLMRFPAGYKQYGYNGKYRSDVYYSPTSCMLYILHFPLVVTVSIWAVDNRVGRREKVCDYVHRLLPRNWTEETPASTYV